MNEFLNDARDALEKAKEKAAPMVENAKVKLGETMDSVKEKAAPVVEKVKGGVSDAVEAVKDGAEKLGDLLSPDAPAVNVKNDFFNELGEQAQAQKQASMDKAEEMQRRLRELMNGGK